MTTPIYDFLRKYKASGVSRFHMPGHKGRRILGIEALDITEVRGADVLYRADGIIAESEANATALFGTAHTYYSTEGSTLGIKAMLGIIAKEAGLGATVLAARNVHKAFIYAAAELNLTVEWIYPAEASHLCSCQITADDLRAAILSAKEKPDAVYITTPDYLGGMLDVRALADECKRQDIPLLVDNAHGAYLAFVDENLHPIKLGAAMCCDSAHKTLPVLTGGAYLHIATGYEKYTEGARDILAAFASTSPSYLTLASLDLCNLYLATEARERIEKCKEKVTYIKALLEDTDSCEPLKIVIRAPRFLNTGMGIAEILRKHRIECEFADGEFAVLMASPQNTERDFKRLKTAAKEIKATAARDNGEHRTAQSPIVSRPTRVMSIREAVFAKAEAVEVDSALGRVCAAPTVSCPPAVPVVVSGELIGEAEIKLFKKYGIDTVSVVKK